MLPSWFVRSVGYSLVLAGLLLCVGCDNTIEPFSEKAAYSIHGVLFTSRSTQFVRVKPLSTPISKVDSGDLQETTVTLKNISRGQTYVLKDSIATFKDAGATIVTHNFATDAPIQPEEEYRLTVDGNAGRTQATTVTATSTPATLTPQMGACDEQYNMIFEDIDDSRRVLARVEMKLEEAWKLPPKMRDGPWVHFPQEEIFKTDEGRVILLFRPSVLLESLISFYDISTPTLPDSLKNSICWSVSNCASKILEGNKIRVRYTYLGPDWYGDIPEDSVAYDPLESYHVQGGLGFFGSARRDRSASRVDTTSIVFNEGLLCGEAPP